MLATGSLLGLNVALNLALIPTFGAEGAAGAFAACEAAALVLMVWLYRRIGAVPVAYRPARLLLAGVAMSAVAALQLLPLVDAGGPIVVLLVFGPLSLGAYVACLHALDAMPREVRTTLVAPIVAKLRRPRGSA
jgi:O-antigen/teichoic acid export membrane protein